MQQVNWGIIGCGNVTEVKSGPAFGKVEGSRVIAVMRRDASKARDYATRHHIPIWYSNADELISNPDVNAVYIATPPSSHAEYAIRCLEQGKITYVEKPMAASYAECKQMHQVSVRTGIPLYVAYYRRYLPYFLRVKEILDRGRLGELLYVRVDFHIPPRKEDLNPDALPWRVQPDIAGAGYFYDLASHQIDLFDWLFGKVRSVTGSKFNRRRLYHAEDTVFAQMVFESGLPLAGTWCFTADESQHVDQISIFGTKATLEFSTFDFTPVKLKGDGQVLEDLPPNPENIQYYFIKNMVEEIRTNRASAGNSESAMNTNKIMDKILGKI